VTLADRVAADYGARLRSFGERAPERFAASVAGFTVVSLGVDEPWGLQLVAMPDTPDPAAVGAAVAWCRERGRDPQIVVRERDRGILASYDVAEVLATLVTVSGGDQQVLQVARASDVAEFRAVYSAAFTMPPGLAEALVVEADLEVLPHLLGRVDGRAVACAILRSGGDLGYVNGVGVLPGEQRRGYGAAMLAACRAEALAVGCTHVWLNAAPHTAPFYEGIGFELVDTYVALTAS
jgi:GNAT superfamily N-acetyltransferase